MTHARQALGHHAEGMVAAELERSGWRVLERNARPEGMRGEIDIVARERGWLVFVEVKAMSSNARRGPETPLLMVDARKRSRLRALAGAWLREHRGEAGPVAGIRIDVVGLRVDAGGRATEWRHVRGAA